MGNHRTDLSVLQLVINTGTTIVTFLMVFLIQNSQNRDSAAIQVKLDELIRVGVAQNSLVGIEHLTDDEIDKIRTECERRAAEKLGDRELQRADKKADDAAERGFALDELLPPNGDDDTVRGRMVQQFPQRH